MKHLAMLALLGLGLPANAAIGALSPEPTPAIRFRQDRIVLQLAPGAVRRLSARPARTATTRLSIPGIDRVADRLGVLGFRPEFHGALASPGSELAGFWLADLPPGADPQSAAEAFRILDDVVDSHPIAIVPVSVIPNDSLWSVSTHLFQPSRRDVHALEAWNATRGDPSIVLAVLDTGVLPNHPDLIGQLWHNAPERDGLAGVDDDGNGFVDDVAGWDFVALPTDDDARALEDWRDEDNDPNDFAGHGTAVSGIAAAHANNTIGIAGMAWEIRVMPLRVGWSSPVAALGLVDLSYAARAIAYAAANGASVINCSFASTAAGDLLAAINAAVAAGVTVVFSAGNNGTPAAASLLPGVISVSATEPTDIVARFSNLHPMVALAAPGLNIPATFIAHAGGDSITDRQPAYTTSASGTSFSAPIVAATAALIQSQRVQLGLPLLSPAAIKLRLMETADAIDLLNSSFKNYGTGRLNAGRALEAGRRSFRVRAAGSSSGPALVIPALRGETRIAFAMDTGEVLFIGGATGDTLERFQLPALPAGAMAAADPGTGIGTLIWMPCTDRRIHAFDLLGRTAPGWPVNATSVTGSTWATPALGDLDGDGQLEVVWGGDDGRVHAWHADGTGVDGFPRAVTTAGPNLIVALADLDDIPGAEIVAAAASGTVIALDGEGASMEGWPQQLPFPSADVIIAETGGAPGPEVIAVGGTELVAWSAGGALRFWRTLPAYIGSGLAAADMDGDGTSEIIVAMIDRVAVVGATGAFRPGFPRLADGVVAGPPVVGGVTSLTAAGIMLSCDDGVDGDRLRGFTSTSIRVARYPLPGGGGRFAVLGQIDGDDATEIVTGTGTDGSLWTFDAGEGTWLEPAWPAPAGGHARTRSNIGAPRLSPFDDAAPDPVSDLVAERRAPTRVTVTWTGVLDEGPAGRPERYEIAAADRPFGPDEFDDAPWQLEVQAVGGKLEVEIAGLSAGTDYYFAVRSIDASGNVSPMSNLATLMQPGAALAHGLRLAPLRNPTGPPVAFGWLAGADVADHARSLRIFDLGGRLLSRIAVGPGREGILMWDARDAHGRAVPPGLYFARFEAPLHSAQARFVIIR